MRCSVTTAGHTPSHSRMWVSMFPGNGDLISFTLVQISDESILWVRMSVYFVAGRRNMGEAQGSVSSSIGSLSHS